LSGPVPAINLHQLFPGSVFVTKYNGARWSKDSTSSLVSFRMQWPSPRGAPRSSTISRAVSRSTTSRTPTGC
jgi:hypothetical protein